MQKMLKIKILFYSLIVSSLSFISFGCQSNKPAAPLLPIEDFFKNPIKDRFQISPAGSKVAFLMPVNNRMNVHVQNLADDEIIKLTNSKEHDIKYFFWANDNRIVYLQDTHGDENYHLYSIGIDKSDVMDLTPFDSATVWIIDELVDIEDEMIIGMNKRDNRIFDAYRINIFNGNLKMIAKNPGNITRWMTDNNGTIRIAVQTDGVNTGLLYRNDENEEFIPALLTDFKDELIPIYFSFDNKYLYALSNIDRDKKAVVKYDLENDKELEVIYEHPEVDCNWLLRSEKRKVIIGVTFTTWKKEIHFFDDKYAKLQQIIEKKLPNLEVVIVSRNRNEDQFIIRTYSDKSLGAYYFFNSEDKSLRKLSEVSPWLNPNNMADTKPIRYKSRDELTIHGYLTLPRGMKAKNLPVVVNPHGGPWTRDYWGFNNEVQFLANRGYAVLQMNYRGSTGYGKKFWQAGFKEWGLKMQEDIEDGIDWLVEQEIADSEQVAIYGYSFGGFASLSAVIRNSKKFACAASYAGFNDVLELLNSVPPTWEPFREMLYEMIGDPEKDIAMLKSISPTLNANKIKVPLLIAQGANDPKVPTENTENFIKTLKKNGVNVKYILKENEGHGFRDEENRIEFYQELENFLAEHLKGRKTEKRFN
jgi:dipeptidyl aminopeptidase/acylaminoacyl peptidase